MLCINLTMSKVSMKNDLAIFNTNETWSPSIGFCFSFCSYVLVSIYIKRINLLLIFCHAAPRLNEKCFTFNMNQLLYYSIHIYTFYQRPISMHHWDIIIIKLFHLFDSEFVKFQIYNTIMTQYFFFNELRTPNFHYLFFALSLKSSTVIFEWNIPIQTLWLYDHWTRERFARLPGQTLGFPTKCSACCHRWVHHHDLWRPPVPMDNPCWTAHRSRLANKLLVAYIGSTKVHCHWWMLWSVHRCRCGSIEFWIWTKEIWYELKTDAWCGRGQQHSTMLCNYLPKRFGILCEWRVRQLNELVVWTAINFNCWYFESPLFAYNCINSMYSAVYGNVKIVAIKWEIVNELINSMSFTHIAIDADASQIGANRWCIDFEVHQ